MNEDPSIYANPSGSIEKKNANFKVKEIKHLSVFSRMRSEGFPFIVGGLGVGSCSRRVRRVVVALSSCRRRRLVNFSLLGGTHALRPNPFLQRMKSGGGLARNARFGGPKSQNGRSFSCFA